MLHWIPNNLRYTSSASSPVSLFGILVANLSHYLHLCNMIHGQGSASSPRDSLDGLWKIPASNSFQPLPGTTHIPILPKNYPNIPLFPPPSDLLLSKNRITAFQSSPVPLSKHPKSKIKTVCLHLSQLRSSSSARPCVCRDTRHPI